ncbi:hypothetical protein PSY28_23100, partial [Shigella flexneri]|nr:hypothetical protein [Shigella flexneri]
LTDRAEKSSAKIITITQRYLALLFSALSVRIFHLPFLMTALVLSIVGLIFAYHKSVWLVLFILSNLPMLATTIFAYQHHFTTLDTVIFF